MHAKIILSNILTLHPSHPRASGVLVVENRVQALGSLEELLAVAPKAEVLDHRDFFLTPGLTDAHIHLVAYGFSLQNVRLEDSASCAEAVSRVAERAARVGVVLSIQGHTRPGIAPTFGERHPHIQQVATTVRAANAVVARESILEVVTELVCDHRAVVFIGVGVGKA